MGQVIDLYRTSPMFRWGVRRGLTIGLSAGFLAGVALMTLILLWAGSR